MEKDFIEEAFDNFHLPTEKKFSDVFRIEQTKIGNQIVALTAVKVGDKPRCAKSPDFEQQ